MRMATMNDQPANTHTILYLLEGQRKQFYIGQANSGQILNMCIKGSHRYTGCSYCAINMLMLGDLGACVQSIC